MLEGDNERLAALNEDTSADSDGTVTDQLLADESVTCWTCDSEVDAEQIESTVERLRELRKETLEEVNSVHDELDDLLAEQSDLEDKQRERERLERRLDQIEHELEDHETTLESLKEERERLTDDIDQLEAEVEQHENEEHSEILGLHKEANQLKFKLGRLESDRDDLDEEIAEIKGRLKEREQLEDQRAELQAELEDPRTRIERIETEAIKEFNDHTETVLELLDYENIERIWLERVEREVREGRRKVKKASSSCASSALRSRAPPTKTRSNTFLRANAKSPGYVRARVLPMHDLHETVPVMLHDSLEAVDADRIATLVDYFKEHVDYLIVALLPEDAAALDEDYQRITDIRTIVGSSTSLLNSCHD